MYVTMIATSPCGICGYIRRAFMFPTMRVNKRSMRSTGKVTLRTGLGHCHECGHSTGEPPDLRWRLDPNDAAKVEAYRLKRWPELKEAP